MSMSASDIRNLMLKVLKLDFKTITASEMECVPLDYILKKCSHRSMEIYRQLPPTLAKQYEAYGPCYEHHNLETSQTHIDGPASSKVKCRQCRCKNTMI